MFDDLGAEIVLQGNRKLVMQFSLNRDNQESADMKNGYVLGHVLAQFLALITVIPNRFSASARASARVAFVVIPSRSTPRCTTVWAIWGRTPLMMHSAPISRMAVTVLRRC